MEIHQSTNSTVRKNLLELKNMCESYNLEELSILNDQGGKKTQPKKSKGLKRLFFKDGTERAGNAAEC